MPPLDPAALRGRLPPSPITRFAPSPTGFLHLGHVANAIYVWGVARALEGRVVLRVEDHDRGRSRPEYEAAALEDLEWLGLGVDLVIRGADLLPSTARQIRLSRMLGRERPPVFLHHPLIRKADGAKLSKSSGDTGIAELRRAGASPGTVLGRAAWLSGLIDRQRDIGPQDLADLFVQVASGPRSR